MNESYSGGKGLNTPTEELAVPRIRKYFLCDPDPGRGTTSAAASPHLSLNKSFRAEMYPSSFTESCFYRVKIMINQIIHQIYGTYACYGIGRDHGCGAFGSCIQYSGENPQSGLAVRKGLIQIFCIRWRHSGFLRGKIFLHPGDDLVEG